MVLCPGIFKSRESFAPLTITVVTEFHVRSVLPRGETYSLNFTRCFLSGIEKMGGCVSTSSRSTCSSRSNGETVPPACLGMGFCRQKRTKRTFSDHVITMHNLPSIPNRIFMNGKSRASCIFTQQGRKGINQDAMIVWEVSFMSSD